MSSKKGLSLRFITTQKTAREIFAACKRKGINCVIRNEKECSITFESYPDMKNVLDGFLDPNCAYRHALERACVETK
jgi:hypothetical protein